MSTAMENFRYWIENVREKETLDELSEIKDNEKEIEDRFGRDIKFGTAGLRGVMESGNNRINVYTVRKATQGLANYINYNNLKKVVAVSYDSRRNSKEFADEVAMVMAANGIEVYMTNELAPTPFLSYMVRKNGASVGVMITASHNTAEYNGYKCYGSDGAQMTETFARGVYEYIKEVDIFSEVKRIEFSQGINNGLIHYVGDDLKEMYLEEVLKYHDKNIDLGDLKVVYTPLNGTGNVYVRKALSMAGLKKIYTVEKQEEPDENFTTCPYPNPENITAFDEALKVANSNRADIILATDPDADRLGVCVKNGEEYRLLSGNEMGILLTNYILEHGRESGDLPQNGVIIKTIVSTMMIEELTKEYACEVRNVLTGFKNIASEIAELERIGQDNRYLFGFEESNGYLCGTYVRDKDAVSASLLVCEAAEYYRSRCNKNLLQVLEDLYSKYGHFAERTFSYDLRNLNMDEVTEKFRSELLREIGGYRVKSRKDYLKSDGKLKSDVVEILLEGGIKVVVRPSGTEPKLKIYVMVKSAGEKSKTETIESVKKGIDEIIVMHKK